MEYPYAVLCDGADYGHFRWTSAAVNAAKDVVDIVGYHNPKAVVQVVDLRDGSLVKEVRYDE